MAGPISYQRAMVLVTGSSMLVPVIGLATAPILTQTLGPVGRGEVGAAMAPGLFIVGGATLGLPYAVAYKVAQRPSLLRLVVRNALLFTLLLGALTLTGTYFASSYLAGGDPDLAALIMVGGWLSLPALVLGVLRGAASGLQMWPAIARERLLSSVLRLLLIGGLALVGELNVTTAVLVMCIGPLLAGLSYVGLVAHRKTVDDAEPASPTAVRSELLRYGIQIWLGSVAVEVMARLSQLLITPLSGVEQLGIYIVAITISDVPFIITTTVREVTFGVNSADSNSERLLATSRIATAAAACGSLVLGATLPFWIEIVFGPGFATAVVPTWILLLSACVAVPGLIAGAGLDSAGRPGLRSIALVVALVMNLGGLLLVVPALGAIGAAVAGLTSTLVSTAIMSVAAARIFDESVGGFVVLRRADLGMLRTALVPVIRRLWPARAPR